MAIKNDTYLYFKEKDTMYTVHTLPRFMNSNSSGSSENSLGEPYKLT